MFTKGELLDVPMRTFRVRFGDLICYVLYWSLTLVVVAEDGWNTDLFALMFGMAGCVIAELILVGLAIAYSTITVNPVEIRGYDFWGFY
ncbi:MAG: hypothetical protein JWM11_810 [Planctomycetaceae bacterium]|nr:hypothetical protein [Planctomycetaceae bacterium]